MAASSWLAMPNSGNSVLMPPSGSVTPISSTAPQAPTMTAVQSQAPGRQECSLNFGTKLPIESCSMKRATRVPASTAVRMNSASNMMAKWYQKLIMAVPPMNCCMMWARPTARVGAPPVRETMLSSPTLAGRLGEHVRADVHAGQSQAVDPGGRGFHGAAGQGRRGVHGEVESAVNGDGRDEGHDGHEGLHQHAAVADEAGLAFLLDQLRCGAGGDQGVESGQRAAGDGDEQEREQRAREDRTVVAAGEFAEGRDGDFRADHDDGQRPASR